MTTKRLIRISYFTLLTVIGGLIRIPVGTVAFTFQTLFVMLSGLILGGVDGAISQFAYLFLGLVGIPVFASGGGFSYVLMPTFGYIIGFISGAFVTGLIRSKMRTLSTLKLWAACAVGLVVIYAVGIAYQTAILTLVIKLTLVAALISLVPIAVYFAIDLALMLIVAIIYPKLTTMIGKSNEINQANL